MSDNANSATPVASAPAAPPFKIGDKVLFRRHPDGVEIVTAVDPCPTGRHHIYTRRQPGALVEATRYARTSQFQFARDKGDRHRGAGVLPLATGGLSIAAWLAITAAVALTAWVLP